MIFKESETVELKECYTKDIKKEIIAFANCNGGKLYIGIRDDGTVVGIDNIDDVKTQISNMVRDSIEPDLTMFISYKDISENNKDILEIEISRGSSKPYYIYEKGPTPKGVYVRQGNSSAPASKYAIMQMSLYDRNIRYENLPSLNQKLTFEFTSNTFKEQNIELGQLQMKTLKMIDEDGRFTNLALLLSDQCEHSVKISVFQGNDETIFRDRLECKGSLFMQIEQALNFVYKYNPVIATFPAIKAGKGVIAYRQDIYDFPPIAIREALFNIFAHQDYSVLPHSHIKIYQDRLEFLSVGGLVPGMNIQTIQEGISACRNENLAHIMYRLKFIEAYGTGIKRIMAQYKDKDEKPIFRDLEGLFKVVLPNINLKTINNHSNTFYNSTIGDNTNITCNITLDPENTTTNVQNLYKNNHVSIIDKGHCNNDNDVNPAKGINTTSAKKNIALQTNNKRHLIILDAFKENSKITCADALHLLDVSHSTAKRVLKEMIENNLIESRGRGRGTYYILKEHDK